MAEYSKTFPVPDEPGVTVTIVTDDQGNELARFFKDEAWLPHRDGDLPAVILASGLVGYYKHGLLHRDGDFPALTEPKGPWQYYKHGRLSREDGKPPVVDGGTITPYIEKSRY